ncbi:hypothetical protein ACLB2K_063386 [Fragaria x ananassa]
MALFFPRHRRRKYNEDLWFVSGCAFPLFANNHHHHLKDTGYIMNACAQLKDLQLRKISNSNPSNPSSINLYGVLTAARRGRRNAGGLSSSRGGRGCEKILRATAIPRVLCDPPVAQRHLFFLPVAVFSLFSGETAHRRLHHTGSPSPRERGRKKKREEEEEEEGRRRRSREEGRRREEEEEEEGRERKKKREEGRRRRGGKKKKQRRKEEEERGRKKKKKQSCEKASSEEEIGFVGEERGRTEEELEKKKHVSLCDW